MPAVMKTTRRYDTRTLPFTLIWAEWNVRVDKDAAVVYHSSFFVRGQRIGILSAAALTWRAEGVVSCCGGR
jgi:hypothetical protein